MLTSVEMGRILKLRRAHILIGFWQGDRKMPTFGIFERRGLVSRSWLVCLALSGVLVLAVVCADADGPPAGMSSEAWAGIQEQLEVERHQVSESNRPGRLWRARQNLPRRQPHTAIHRALRFRGRCSCPSRRGRTGLGTRSAAHILGRGARFAAGELRDRHSL